MKNVAGCSKKFFEFKYDLKGSLYHRESIPLK